ncbi:zinc ABC transporter substrate-binding protein [Frondihabitans sp. 4ASC-45]|uniref:metal ABC transporter solute-binding protein, Zn/Mn family n=1 Tax=Frondihabitans sp. 4ASC-45 TaxID=3111636 RepID=UPI003C175E20
MKTSRLLPSLALAATGALALAGCSASGGAAPDDSTIKVVASTNVYGDIAKQIGGSSVTVTSILSNPNQDPHGFEADAQTQLAISKADLIIENGGGYDDYVDTMRSSTNSKATLLNAVKVSGFTSSDGELNEHVFYDYPTMSKLANRIATDLSTANPDESKTFFNNAVTFNTAMEKLEAQTAALKKTYDGDAVAYTEPVPGYLFDAIGLKNATPGAFSEAVEEGEDVPPSALNETLKLMTGKKVALLAYNEQAGSPETEQVQKAAETAGVPVVPVTETLPKGDDYQTWQQSNIDAVKAALAQ